jgi:hypothetical protein
LAIGSTVACEDLPQFRDELASEDIRMTNIDDEDITEGLRQLAAEAIKLRGALFVQ